MRNALRLGSDNDDDDWAKMIESLMSPNRDNSDATDSLINTFSHETPIDSKKTKESKPPESTKLTTVLTKNPIWEETSSFLDNKSLLESATPRDSEPHSNDATASIRSATPFVRINIPPQPPKRSQTITETTSAEKAEFQPSTPSTALESSPTSPQKNMAVALSEAKDALKNEKIKRVTADMLLMKLYKELQKLKLVTQTGRQVKKLEDLQSDITMLEQRKLALEKSVPIPQISSFEQISAKIDRQAFSFKRRCLFSLVF